MEGYVIKDAQSGRKLGPGSCLGPSEDSIELSLQGFIYPLAHCAPTPQSRPLGHWLPTLLH